MFKQLFSLLIFAKQISDGFIYIDIKEVTGGRYFLILYRSFEYVCIHQYITSKIFISYEFLRAYTYPYLVPYNFRLKQQMQRNYLS